MQNVCGMTFHAHIKFKIVAILKEYFILYRLHKKDKLIHLHGIAKNKKKCFKTKKKNYKSFPMETDFAAFMLPFQDPVFFSKIHLKVRLNESKLCFAENANDFLQQKKYRIHQTNFKEFDDTKLLFF